MYDFETIELDRFMIWRKLQPKILHQESHCGANLNGSKSRSGTGAWSGSKWQVDWMIAHLWIREPVWIEFLRVREIVRVAVSKGNQTQR